MLTDFGCMARKLTGFGLRGSRTSVTMTPRRTRVPMYAWPRATVNLDAVASATLVGMAEEFNIARAFGDNHRLLPSLIGAQCRAGDKN